MKALLACVLLLSVIVPPVFAADAPCIGVMCAFSHTGPGRPPAIEDQIPPAGFLDIFGEEPPPFGVGGRPINLTRDMAPVIAWRRGRREFKELADFSMDGAVVEGIMTHTGGVPLAWSTHRGKTYVAVVGGPVDLFRIPTLIFTSPNMPAINQVVAVVHNMVSRGACVPSVPGGSATAKLSANNKRNCGK